MRQLVHHGTDFVILGGEKGIVDNVAHLWAKVSAPTIRIQIVDSRTAELAKLMENSFLACKVTFFNQFFDLAELFDVNYHQLRETFLLDDRMGRSYTQVYPDNRGYAGKCLPKDVANAIFSGKKFGADVSLLEAMQGDELIQSLWKIDESMTQKKYTNDYYTTKWLISELHPKIIAERNELEQQYRNMTNTLINKCNDFGNLSRKDKIKWLIKKTIKKILPNQIFNVLKLLKNSPKKFIEKCFLIFLYKQDLSWGGGYDLYLKGMDICVLKKRYSRFDELCYRNDLSIDEEKEIIQKMYFDAHQEYLDLDNPKTYNEKINWLKLYDRNPLMTICSDKYAVREYIKEKIGEEYLVPSLGGWDKAEDIDFDALPNQFVFKINWGSGQNIIVRDKSQLNIPETIKQLNRWMKNDYNLYHWNMEWGYKNINSS